MDDRGRDNTRRYIGDVRDGGILCRGSDVHMNDNRERGITDRVKTERDIRERNN
jgi:hypothetical protein